MVTTPKVWSRPAAAATRATRALTALCCLMLVWLSAGTVLAAGAFVAGTDDVPLMPGLEAVSEAAVLFDQPDGRIVEAVADGTVPAARVRQFYAETLPQLGWKADGDGAWRREQERLEVKIAETGGRTQVRFLLSPRDGAPR